MSDWCDYCHVEIPEATARLRAIGFEVIRTISNPIVKLWCGKCIVPDDIDIEAQKALVRILANRSRYA